MNHSQEWIQTATGPIPAADLGRTYIHEHLRIDLSAYKNDPDADLNEPELIAAELRKIKQQGINALVEVTNRGMGRDVRLSKRLAEDSGIRVIVSTGFYKEPFFPPEVHQLTERELAEILRKELLEGIGDTGIKAHVIGEIGTIQDAIAPAERKVFAAAARAHRETGRPIFTHTTLGTMALEQLQLLQQEGVDLSKVVISHLDLRCDLDYHLRVADSGCFLGFDTIGKLKYESDQRRAELIRELIDRGHLRQIVLAQDITRRSHLTANGGTGYGYLWDEFLPILKRSGVRDEAIETLLVENPRRLLAVQAL